MGVGVAVGVGVGGRGVEVGVGNGVEVGCMGMGVGVAVGRGIVVGVGVEAGLQPGRKRPARARRIRKNGFLIIVDLWPMSPNLQVFAKISRHLAERKGQTTSTLLDQVPDVNYGQ
jgi:hypothetical protein